MILSTSHFAWLPPTRVGGLLGSGCDDGSRAVSGRMSPAMIFIGFLRSPAAVAAAIHSVAAAAAAATAPQTAGARPIELVKEIGRENLA